MFIVMYMYPLSFGSTIFAFVLVMTYIRLYADVVEAYEIHNVRVT